MKPRPKSDYLPCARCRLRSRVPGTPYCLPCKKMMGGEWAEKNQQRIAETTRQWAELDPDPVTGGDKSAPGNAGAKR